MSLNNFVSHKIVLDWFIHAPSFITNIVQIESELKIRPSVTESLHNPGHIALKNSYSVIMSKIEIT